MKSILKRLLPLLLPISIMIGASIIYTRVDTLPDSAQKLIIYFSYSLMAVVMLLSFIFNRSRLFFISSIIFISQIVLMLSKASVSIDSFNSLAVKAMLYIILPVDITIFSIKGDKGIMSSSGRLRMSVILFEFLSIAWVIITNRIKFIQFISSTPIGIGKLTPVPIIVVIIFSLTFIFFTARIILHGLLKDRLLFVVLISVFSGLFSRNSNLAIPVFFAIAGIILLICVLHEAYYLAYIDELTALPSRRALKEKLMKLRGKYTIAMIDIDFFKKFNDSYGHDSGDVVLSYIGKCLKQIPGGGRPYRYGGEEFTVIFPGKSISEAIPYMEKLRETIAKSRIPLVKKGSKSSSAQRAKKVSITISSGVAERNEKHPEPMDVIKAADAALYRAKDKGRNCVSK